MTGQALTLRLLRTRRRRAVAHLVTPMVVATVLMWPALHESGALASRDLLFLDRLPVPQSLYWLGPDLPRRLPGFVPIAWLSLLIDAAVVGRIVMFATLVVMGVGVSLLVSRLLAAPTHPANGSATAPSAPPAIPTRLVAGGLAAAAVMVMPFTLTRFSVGHLTTMWAMAMLPWLLLAVLRDPDRAARSGAAGAAGLLGFVAGSYSLVVVLAASSRRRLGHTLGSWGARNAIWLLPGLFLQSLGFTTLTEPEGFRPSTGGLLDVPGLVLGRWYWDPGAEALRGDEWTVLVVALLLVAAAAWGWPTLPRHVRRVVGACLVIGYVPVLFAVTPGLSSLLWWFVDTPVGSPLREPHRLIGLGLLPLVCVAAVGLADLARRSTATGVAAIAVPSLLAALLLAGALPTVHRRLDPMPMPSSWREAADLTEREGGVVMALPWSEYVLLRVDRPRVVYSPLPDLFGNETLASTDPAMGAPVNEAADPRAELGAAAAARLIAGEDVRPELAALGVRFVAVLKVEAVEVLDLTSRPGFTRVVGSSSLDLYRVASDATPVARPVPFVAGAGRPTSDVPWTWGWWSPGDGVVGRTPAGVLQPHGRAVFLPAAPALVAAVWTSCLVIAPILRRSVLKRDTKVI